MTNNLLNIILLYLNDNERHVETIWPPMFGFRLLPTNSDLIIIKKLFRAANFSGAGGDEKLKIIFNWPKQGVIYRHSQALRYRRIITDDNILRNQLEKLY